MREGNLFEPAPGTRSHRPFDGQAKRRSMQRWAAKNRRWLGLAGLTGVAAATIGAALDR